jgi:hypothetical protein
MATVSELISHNNLLNTPIYGYCFQKSSLLYKIAYIRSFFRVPRMMKRTRNAIPNSQKAALHAQHQLKPYLSLIQLQK